MKIAVGNSRMDKKWKNQDISWTDLCARCGSTIRTTETVEEYRKLKKGQQDGIKDVGGFVGGHLREGRRKNGMVLCRSLLTLDMDYGTPDIWDEITLFHDFKCCVYSTHKHTPEHPRLRLLIPLKREISEEEYPAVARMVAKEIGIDLFDDTTYEASRLMYWPSTSANGEFFYKVQAGGAVVIVDHGVLVEGVVVIEILIVGLRGGGRGVALWRVVAWARVSLRVVEFLVPV